MLSFSIDEVCSITGGRYYSSTKGDIPEITSITTDLSNVKDGSLFCCLKKEEVSAQQEMIIARLRGAAVVMAEVAPYNDKIPYIYTSDTLLALQALAKKYRTRIKTKIIGITGSVGKTTTKEMLASVLSKKYRTYKTPGNLNSQSGVPCCLLSIDENDEYAVLEMGISLPGEMERLSQIVCPDICIILNISDAHLEGLKTRENILKEKCKIYKYLPKDGMVFLNKEDELLRNIHYVNGIQSNFFNGKTYLGPLPYPGEHFRLNASAVASVATKLGFSDKEILDGIVDTQNVWGRCTIEKLKTSTIINDCYNANPVSVKAALDMLCDMPSPRIAILGDMLELGIKQEELHCEIGTYAASKDIDKLIFIGTLAKSMYSAAIKNNFKKELSYFKDVPDFKNSLNTLSFEGETILIKASRKMAFENIEKYIIDGDQ